MKIIAIMQNVDGIEDYLEKITSLLNDAGIKNEIILRTNLENAKKSISNYDVVIIHQHLSNVPIEVSEIDDMTNDNSKAQFIVIYNDENFGKKLFSVGMFNGLHQSNSGANEIVKIIQQPRDRNEAKNYYKVTTLANEFDGKILSDHNVKRYIEHIQNHTDLEDGFTTIIENLSTEKILFLIKRLPKEIYDELERCETFSHYNRMLVEKEKPTEIKTIILEKETKVSEIVEKTRITNDSYYRRKVITVAGQSELCAELAYTNAKHTDDSVLIIDLDAFTPEIHHILGMKETINDGISIDNCIGNSSFYQAYEVATKKNLNHEILRSIAVQVGHENLFVLTGNELFEKSESFRWEVLERIINIALNSYTIIYVNVPFDVYKAMTLYMITNPLSTTIIGFDGGAIDLKNKERVVNLVKKNQGLSLKDLKYVAFNYSEKVNLEKAEINKLTHGALLGLVPYEEQRIKARNDFHSNYSKNMSRKTEDNYRVMLEKLGVPVKPNMKEKLSRIFRRNK